VFIGVGLGSDQPLGVKGEDLAGVEGAVAYIEKLKLGKVPLEGVRRAVVIGGGNTAVDAVNELLGLGVPEVTLLYRGVEARMPGYAQDWNAAKLAGARASWQTLPVAFEGDGKLQRVRCVRTDAAKKPIPGTEHVLEADLALVAIGQKSLGELFKGLDGIRFEKGQVVVGEDGATGRKGWFAGGDCANGGTEVVYAAAEGKRAARAIHQYLMGGRHG
jgi:glutamate synthase (NADPH/NADH) small chain